MTLNLGAAEIAALKLGSGDVSKAYLGATEVYGSLSLDPFSVVWTNDYDLDSETFTIDLTGAGHADGDLLVWFAHDRDGNATFTFDGTAVSRNTIKETNDAHIWHTTLDGTETTLSSSANVPNNFTAVAMVLRGVSWSSFEFNSGNGSTISFTGGLYDGDTVALALYGLQDDDSLSTAVPTGYTLIDNAANTAGGTKTAVSGSRKVLADPGSLTTETPGNVTSPANKEWGAWTVILPRTFS